jgi:putative addiction module component (TIGR02574 family)
VSTLLQALGLDQLPPDDRRVLAQELWDSLADDASPFPLTDAQRRELERRLAEYDANPDNVVSWEEVKARTAARLRS